MSRRNVVDLVKMTTPLPDVKLPSVAGQPGRELPIKPLTVAGFKLVARAETGDNEAVTELIRRAIPGITDEEIDEFDLEMISRVIQLVSGRVQEVLDALAEAKREQDEAAKSEASNPPTPPAENSDPGMTTSTS